MSERNEKISLLVMGAILGAAFSLFNLRVGGGLAWEGTLPTTVFVTAISSVGLLVISGARTRLGKRFGYHRLLSFSGTLLYCFVIASSFVVARNSPFADL